MPRSGLLYSRNSNSNMEGKQQVAQSRTPSGTRLSAVAVISVCRKLGGIIKCMAVFGSFSVKTSPFFGPDAESCGPDAGAGLIVGGIDFGVDGASTAAAAATAVAGGFGGCEAGAVGR